MRAERLTKMASAQGREIRVILRVPVRYGGTEGRLFACAGVPSQP